MFKDFSDYYVSMSQLRFEEEEEKKKLAIVVDHWSPMPCQHVSYKIIGHFNHVRILAKTIMPCQ